VDWRLPYPTIRQPILAADCVATSQPFAAQARQRSRRGDRDAIALTVSEQVMNGTRCRPPSPSSPQAGAVVALNSGRIARRAYAEARIGPSRPGEHLLDLIQNPAVFRVRADDRIGRGRLRQVTARQRINQPTNQGIKTRSVLQGLPRESYHIYKL
jgi:hypothetical protein